MVMREPSRLVGRHRQVSMTVWEVLQQGKVQGAVGAPRKASGKPSWGR